MFIRNKDREVRLVWCLLMLVGVFLAIAYLLRYLPIRIETSRLINLGMSDSDALSTAQYHFLEEPIRTSLIGIVQGLFWLPLVILIIRFIEKQKFTWSEMGFSLQNKKLWFIPLGFGLGILLYFGTIRINPLLGETSFTWDPPKQPIAVILLLTANFLVNGFGEELAFRAYFQNRLIQRHGQWLGILIGSTAFVLLHLLVAPFSIPVLVASILLSGIYGILYVWSKSIYLVGIMHTMFNLIPRLLDQWPSDLALLIGNGSALFLVILFFLVSRKTAQAR